MIQSEIQTRKQAIGENRKIERPLGALPEGWARLAIESFSVTANNVTYAVVGDGFGYWNFFPPRGEDTEGWGIVPMWGHARVVESKAEAIEEGERVYGYLPMATHLDVKPGNISAASFTDMAEHRQPMSPIYNQYTRLAADPEHDPAREAERMIFGPLFKTGFLIEFFMRSQDWFGAEQVILTSASSKTALGLASVTKRRSPKIRRIGLTSPGNVEFVRATGLYDEVLSYDEIERIAKAPSVSVDFAGNAAVLRRIHEHLRENLRYSCLVGATHIEERGTLDNGEELPGAPPALFFAPDHALEFFKQLGPEEAGRQMAESWRAFLGDVAGTVTIERHHGIEAARDQFAAMARGAIDPAKGIVIEF